MKGPFSRPHLGGAYCVEGAVHQKRLWLTPQGALIDAVSQTAFVSDLHLGKSTSFRRAGLGVPEGSDQETLMHLSAVLGQYRPRCLVVLGDLVHDVQSLTPRLQEQLAALRSQHSDMPWHLVMGNHDRKASEALRAHWAPLLRLTVFQDHWQEVPGFLGVHSPQDLTDARGGTDLPQRVWLIAGHLHPSVLVAGGARQRLRLRCFAYRAGQWLLPAFGAFTGSFRLQPKDYDAVYPVADGRVFCLKPHAQGATTDQ
ncbi:MAG: ligase-associated DNA damage response endonuclease PdeM [Betaproteobacteria bacterium]|nr:ligase-associated DNA damage response endonuclease PdeM [Betaproteobacteria bacterium]